MIVHLDAQGSPEWLAARRGVITASRFKDCRDKLKTGAPSKACLGYAMDVARERAGGLVPPLFQSAAMRTGTIEEPVARMMREAETGEFIDESGFITTDDKKFGMSVDGLIGEHGIWECKTMVSSATLFTALVYGDISEYREQCVGGLWMLRKQWVDLSLWCPDLSLLHTIRIQRDEEEIQQLEDDLVAFEGLVSKYESDLRSLLSNSIKANKPQDVI